MTSTNRAHKDAKRKRKKKHKCNNETKQDKICIVINMVIFNNMYFGFML